MVVPAQPSRAPSVQVAPQPIQAAQAIPQPAPEAPQSAAAAAAPVKREGAALLLFAHSVNSPLVARPYIWLGASAYMRS